jgi:hypothetical protein
MITSHCLTVPISHSQTQSHGLTGSQSHGLTLRLNLTVSPPPSITETQSPFMVPISHSQTQSHDLNLNLSLSDLINHRNSLSPPPSLSWTYPRRLIVSRLLSLSSLVLSPREPGASDGVGWVESSDVWVFEKPT